MNIEKLAREAGLLPTDIGPVVETRNSRAKVEKLKRFAHAVLKEAVEALRTEYMTGTKPTFLYDLEKAILALKDKT